MDYNQFWNNRTWTQENEQTAETDSDQVNESVVEKENSEQVNWSQEFDYDDSESTQEPEKYDALISPDAYSYLDNVSDSEFSNDSLLDEQDEIESQDDYDAPQDEEDGVDDSEMYNGDSLFDVDDTDFTEEPDVVTEPETEKETVNAVESAPEPEPVQEIVTETVSENNSENNNLQSDEISTRAKFELPLFKKIFSFIPDFSSFGTYIKGLSDADASDLEQFIISSRDAWFEDNKDKMFNLPNSSITIAVLNENKDPMTEVMRLESVAAQMISSYKEKWNFIELFFEYDGTLKLAVDKEINRSLFSDGEWKVIREMGYKILMSKK